MSPGISNPKSEIVNWTRPHSGKVQFEFSDLGFEMKDSSNFAIQLNGGPDANKAWGNRPGMRRAQSDSTELNWTVGPTRTGVGEPARSEESAKRLYRTELDGGPDANKAWGNRPGVRRARSGCTELNWTVGPTLIKGGRN